MQIKNHMLGTLVKENVDVHERVRNAASHYQRNNLKKTKILSHEWGNS